MKELCFYLAGRHFIQVTDHTQLQWIAKVNDNNANKEPQDGFFYGMSFLPLPPVYLYITFCQNMHCIQMTEFLIKVKKGACTC